jgi:hypothetical protein
MRFKTLILCSFALLSLLAANSYAILDPSEIGASERSSLADALIDQSQGITSKERPMTPQEARKLQEGRSIVWTPMPSSLEGQSKNPKAPRGSVSEDKSKAQSSSLPTVEENRIDGSWSFVLNDTESKKILLTLFQIEDAIFGSGSIKAGENTFVAAASGKITGDNLDLNIISLGTLGLYRLSATLSNEAVTGMYKSYSANGQIDTGDLQGIRNLPMS